MGRRGEVTDEERQERRELWRQAQELTPFVAAEHGQAVFLVPTQADGRFFQTKGRKEFVVLERVVSLLREAGRPVDGTTFVDIGAHIGTTTVVALVEHGFATAVAVEPDPENVRLLRANVALNGLHERATVVPAAIAAAAGTSLFALASPARGDAYWTKGRLVSNRSNATIEVATVSLDGLVEDGLVDPAATGLLWLDCQKQELEALAAASTFFERRVPVVFAFRPRTLAPADPLVATFAEAYASYVNLRPTNARINWTPTFHPVEELAILSGERRSVTDVLLVP